MLSRFRVGLRSGRAASTYPRATSCAGVIKRTAAASGLGLREEEEEGEGAAAATVVSLLTEEQLAQRVLAGDFPSAVARDFKAKRGDVATLYSGAGRTLLAGMGAAADADGIRAGTAAAVHQMRKLRVGGGSIRVPSGRGNAGTVAHAALLSNYRFGKYLGAVGREDGYGPPPSLTAIHLLTPDAGAGGDAETAAAEAADAAEAAEAAETAAVARAEAFAQGACFARDLANDRADEATPAALEAACRALAAAHPDGRLAVEVLQLADLRAAGMNLHVAVGQGVLDMQQLGSAGCGADAAAPTEKSPRLILLTLRGTSEEEGEAAPPTALVGKGITFDTGGLNLKPTDFIEDMHLDMGGAAAVIGAMHIAAALGTNRRTVVAALALAENAIGPAAVKPHAIVSSHKGISVEIGNTDAEGRLVLADALSYVQRRYAPARIVDTATLTGACVVALGEYAAGLFSNDDALSAALRGAGERAGERAWPMPILDEHDAELEGHFADVRSIGKGRMGGACTAAAFLRRFVDEGTPWAHIDIAGPAMYSEQRGHMCKGGTGFGAQLLAEFVLSEEEDL
jgi:leucyl aminopeptidase